MRNEKLIVTTLILSLIMDKIFETNSSFHAELRTTGKSQFLFRSGFFQY